MGRRMFSCLGKKMGIGLLMAIWIISAMGFSVWAAPEAAQVSLKDGEYTISVALEGGSGRAGITSPAKMIVRDGKGYALIEWSSPNYDYMKIQDAQFKPVQKEGNSVFELPITEFDTPVAVVADTTAMGTPHEIEYTLTFLQDSVKRATSFGMVAVAAGAVIVVIAVVIVFWIKRRKKAK